MSDTEIKFNDLDLSEAVLKAVAEVGYESPSPIQAQSIPHILDGKDMLGQAQTGTGKTAAFALPLLTTIDASAKKPQLLVMAPTRELAIQVAEAFQGYAKYLPNFHVLPIYGGQSYGAQLKQLKRGAQVVVGTPGRLMDLINKKALDLSELKAIVLDEADEMLRMGFIDDVEWILSHTPEDRQTILFSATMPREIKKIINNYLQEPEIVKIEAKTTTATTIRQRYWQVSGLHKLDALTRILEVEEFDAMIIFVRTKSATEELAQKLQARGYSAAPLNGDIPQQMRERTIDKLKDGQLDIVIATDVVARGLDVKRMSHVINYDIPYDTESYVHRIGRTGRAGRNGDAILFVAPRERRMLKSIERATKQPIEVFEMPSAKDINQMRIENFKKNVISSMENDDLDEFFRIASEIEEQYEVDPLKLAAAFAKLSTCGQSLMLNENEPDLNKPIRDDDRGDRRRGDRNRRDRNDRGNRRSRDRRPPGEGMARYRIDVGHDHGAKVGNIVGAIANEADINSRNIGQIDIQDSFTFVDLPKDLSRDQIHTLRKARVAGRQMNIGEVKEGGNRRDSKPRNKKPRR